MTLPRTELEKHTTGELQLYGAALGSGGPGGCQDYSKIIKLKGVLLVDEDWLNQLISDRDDLREALGELYVAEGTTDDTGIGPMPSHALQDATAKAAALIDRIPRRYKPTPTEKKS